MQTMKSTKSTSAKNLTTSVWATMRLAAQARHQITPNLRLSISIKGWGKSTQCRCATLIATTSGFWSQLTWTGVEAFMFLEILTVCINWLNSTAVAGQLTIIKLNIKKRQLRMCQSLLRSRLMKLVARSLSPLKMQLRDYCKALRIRSQSLSTQGQTKLSSTPSWFKST